MGTVSHHGEELRLRGRESQKEHSWLAFGAAESLMDRIVLSVPSLRLCENQKDHLHISKVFRETGAHFENP